MQAQVAALLLLLVALQLHPGQARALQESVPMGDQEISNEISLQMGQSPAKQLQQTKSAASQQSYSSLARLIGQLQRELLDQVIKQRMVEKDHLLMERWLVDNVNDLHRELKQTEGDFEHYMRVTKNIFLRNEAQLKRQLALATSLPLSIQLQTVPRAAAAEAAAK